MEKCSGFHTRILRWDLVSIIKRMHQAQPEAEGDSWNTQRDCHPTSPHLAPGINKIWQLKHYHLCCFQTRFSAQPHKTRSPEINSRKFCWFWGQWLIHQELMAIMCQAKKSWAFVKFQELWSSATSLLSNVVPYKSSSQGSAEGLSPPLPQCHQGSDTFVVFQWHSAPINNSAALIAASQTHDVHKVPAKPAFPLINTFNCLLCWDFVSVLAEQVRIRAQREQKNNTESAFVFQQKTGN